MFPRVVTAVYRGPRSSHTNALFRQANDKAVCTPVGLYSHSMTLSRMIPRKEESPAVNHADMESQNPANDDYDTP